MKDLMMLHLSFKEAINNLNTTKHAMWRNSQDVECNNLLTNPRFSVNSDSKVFTIGSCFAREIEIALMELKFNVLTRSVHYPYPHGYLNRYNTAVMLQDLDFYQ